MPDCFATAVWVNPAAMRQCRTDLAKRDSRCSKCGAIFCDFAKRVPDIMDCRDDNGCFICKQQFPEHRQYCAIGAGWTNRQTCAR